MQSEAATLGWPNGATAAYPEQGCPAPFADPAAGLPTDRTPKRAGGAGRLMLTVIVDGDNLMRALRLWRGNDLSAGEIFLQRLELAAVSLDWEVTVVFDGPERFLRREAGPLVVQYAPPGKTADTVIERRVHVAPDRSQIVVVTQDRAEANLVLGLGARVWTPQRLSEELQY